MEDDPDNGGGDDPGSRWLTTYGDAMTLLLVFFVLLLSMSTIDPETFHVVISSFQGAVGVFDAGRTLTPGELMDMGINVHELSEAETTVSENIPRNVKNKLHEKMSKATVREDERGLVIQITDQLLFDPGQTSLTPEGRTYLENVSEFLNSPGVRQRQVRVEGHTDSVPTEQYSSNWEISVLRAKNVVERLINIGVQPNRLSAVGFGATRPIASNDTPESRAKNRRVQIVILREDLTREQT